MPPSLCLHYADASAAQAFLAAPEHVLGVIGFGAGGHPAAGSGLPFAAAPLSPVEGMPHYEIWTTDTVLRPFALGPVSGMRGADVAFGAVVLEERAGETLDAAAERAYRAIFAALGESGAAQPLRFWNYLTRILEDEQGMERYRRFNIGRHRAFLDHLTQSVPPAASCVGGLGEQSVVYFLAGLQPAQPVENPRQVSAYDYPPQYGPRSPSFSRAGLFAGHMFISGTASIVGHETRHAGDVLAQARETLANLRALCGQAGIDPATMDGADWAYKIYLRTPQDRALVAPLLDEAFGTRSQKLYLHGVVCRADLALEIEAFRHQPA